MAALQYESKCVVSCVEEFVRGVIDETDDKDNTKEELVKALLNQSKKKSFFMSKTSIAEKILKDAKAIDSTVTNSFLVEDKPRGIFIRILSLYSLSNFW